jgi:hypothetical protein
MKTRFAIRAALALLLCTTGCDRLMPKEDQSLPAIDVITELYERHGINAAEYRYSGNVAEVVIQQPRAQLDRGGELWARVGPYVYLFSPATRELFESYAGVAGVRVITRVGQREVARALLVRDKLNDFGWRRATSLLSQVLTEGTQRPTTLDRLVSFGEEQSTFQYNPDYVAPRGGGS